MSEVVRLYQYKSLLSGRRAVSAEDLMARLEISRATLKRDIAKLRDQLHVPIEFDRDAGGYTLSQGHTDPFSAKGMRQVYGRGDHFGGGRTFQLYIWKNKHGQLFMRCWSHYSDYLPRSFPITGVNPQVNPKVDGKPDLREEWVPQVVRDAYDDWAREEF